MALKRLNKELKDITAKGEKWGISAGPIGNDMFHWQAVIEGPEGTPYAGGVFFVDMKVPKDFPFKPPRCKFDTKIYHPNINADGTFCGESVPWSPALTLLRYLTTLRQLLIEPNWSEPLQPTIASQYAKDKNAFAKQAREWTTKFAS
eukprot:TRINITY_DN74989_c0_g1_i1.p2 TRINITY_DN74989_c0_g1~~TRINITY_DN74989_c0_g1_i1.p2  ORF type:complete len:147 (-),score=60.82 TRINITY_DN74989_c0_g1_i1:46-486(-)